MERNYWSHRWAREGKYNRATRTQPFPDTDVVVEGRVAYAVMPSGAFYEIRDNGWHRVTAADLVANQGKVA